MRMENYTKTMVDHGSKLLVCLLVLSITLAQSSKVNITILDSAITKGAVCLDGSPPAYYYAKGCGEGSNNWLVYLEGGAWCGDDGFCPIWINGKSTYRRPKSVDFFYILSDRKAVNPDFYNWNRVYVAYCDGSSFLGDVEEPSPANFTRRGARIFNAVMEDLLAKGMRNADNAILSGGSAGGLATIFHCDGFRALIPNANRVKCISDSGFFIHANNKNLLGFDRRDRRFSTVVPYHNVTKFLSASCTSKMKPGLCMYPEYFIGEIKTPIFLLESGFDSYQIKSGLVPESLYSITIKTGETPKSIHKDVNWTNCADNLISCTPSELQSMKDFRTIFLKTLRDIGNSSSRGMFIDSCHTHGHLFEAKGWHRSPVLGNKTIAKAIGDWYFDRSYFYEMDAQDVMPRKCNPRA